MLIDATTKWHYPPVSLPQKEFMERARQIWEQSAFTRLTRKHLEEIIGIGNDVKSKKIREEDAVNKICRILRGSI
jgi:hypothetical protein